ncbi:Hypothetical predicted protein [Marmota monax]|uniref:Uncharacterized protein n=1 Tax=Marmota monax TaxID=9995 RepID=A0A5E4AQQ2_MARMO|nr:hypothetical protein GHT09_010024 [Marmota monax]VTJ59260.1 Hypothetical predicted protein [Marmota monax]
MGDPGSEIIESAPPAGPEASESTTDENEDDIQFVSEGLSRPVLEYIDLVCGDDEESNMHHSDSDFVILDIEVIGKTEHQGSIP